MDDVSDFVLWVLLQTKDFVGRLDAKKKGITTITTAITTMTLFSLLLAVLFLWTVPIQSTVAFSAIQQQHHHHHHHQQQQQQRRRLPGSPLKAHAYQHGPSKEVSVGGSDRRTFLTTTISTVTTAASVLLSTPTTSKAATEDNITSTIPGSSAQHPVVVIGAGGRTGMEVSEALAKQGLYTMTMTRTGRDPFQIVKLKPDIKSYIAHFPSPLDMTASPDSLQQILTDTKASAIVYCASASKQGGNAFQVDGDGVGTMARIAATMGARFVLVSALAVDRPDSQSYKVTNSIGGNYDKIMDAKLLGEQQTKQAFAGKGVPHKNDYVIVRPGVLLSGKTKSGAVDLELNQGDMVGGGLSRDELAGVVVGSLQSGRTGVTVEVYRTSTRSKLEPGFVLPSGNEHYATTYAGLFDNTKSD